MRSSTNRTASTIRALRRLAAAVVVSVFALIAPAYAQVDTDLDGVDDAQEAIDGTNPQNPDSVLEHGGSEYCLEWNGGLNRLQQRLDLRNASCSELTVQVSLRVDNGSVASTQDVVLAPYEQNQIIINTLEGYDRGSAGQVCATIIVGEPDSLDAQMGHYRLQNGSFQFAFAVPYTPGRTGNQHLTYNRDFPALREAKRGSSVMTTVQVFNEESTTQLGTAVFYRSDGSVASQVLLTIPGKGRAELSLRGLVGRNRVGLIEWQPALPDKVFRLSQLREYLDDRSALQSAISIVAHRPSGAVQASPFRTGSRATTVELTNTLATPTTVILSAYRANGRKAGRSRVRLAPRQTKVVTLWRLLRKGLGNVKIEPTDPRSVIARTFEYAVHGEKIVSLAHSAALKSGFGATMSTDYDNRLGRCRMRLANLSATSQTATVEMLRSDGSSVPIPSLITVPGNGAVDVNVCSNDTVSGSGSITLQPAVSQTIVGELLERNRRSSAAVRIPLVGRNACTPTASTDQ
ncbi:MAG: hypothetical protein IT290_09120 [Deltaproteobacteria bacterium]|nr:hypothetical protein [Deltaproteobacteria bacterium]